MARRKIVPRDESARATRAALIAAGLASFDRDGLDISLDAICARAKLTRGAFYVHFADRDAFIVAVMREVIDTFVAGLALLPDGRSGGIARAIELYIAAVDAGAPAVIGGRALRLQHVLEACRRSAVIGGAYRDVLTGARDRLAGAIAADQAAGRVRRDVDAGALADLMVITALGFATRHELELPLDVARTARTMLALVQPG
jgi:AcrR family transcriptional regulator|nr:TetR/AcrR family transcriptional regulator [Kofleriaceae bacterium]